MGATLHAVRVFGILLGLAGVGLAGGLREGFEGPPDSARAQAWWHWMNGNVSREGITKDLEGMKKVGLGGFEVFNVVNQVPAGPVGYMTPEWFGLMKFAMTEADRVGLEMCYQNCAGWSSSGGPWITPERSMQEVVWTETVVEGGKSVEVKLAEAKGKRGYYKDVAVVAFAVSGEDKFRLSDWEWKVDGNNVGNRPKDSQIVRDTRVPGAGEVIGGDQVVVLTGKMGGDGVLKWEVPTGKWVVIRFGQTTTGKTNHPAAPGGVGLECNKLDRGAVKWQWDHSVEPVIAAAGDLVPRVFHDVLIDSYEVGYQNWTAGLDEIFKKRMGYDLWKYAPCLTGRVVGSVEESERFLWDYRRVIADLMAENYFGYMKELCHEKGMILSVEPYGNGGFDYFQVAAVADLPMGEFWVDRPTAWHKWSSKLASSAGHAQGKSVVGAESFTSEPHVAFSAYPYSIKTLGDRYMADGISRFIFHTDVHQPWGDDVVPGMVMGPHGMQLNRNNTWYGHARGWMDSIARTQYLLQSGKFVADMCYVASEDAPQTPLERKDMKPMPPAGYDYDVLWSGFVGQMKVEGGRLVLPSGMSYGVLVLPDEERMRPELLEKVLELKRGGAKIFVPRRITRSPSLAGGAEVDEKVRKMGEELGSGGSLAEMLPAKDVDVAEGTSIVWLHRSTEEGEVYYVANQTEKPIEFEAGFRARGVAEVWHTEDGRIERGVMRGGKVAMRLEAAESVFVVFGKKSDAPLPVVWSGEGAVEVGGPWEVKFPAGWGAPEKVEMAKLASWTESGVEGVKHFSGTAVYETTFDVAGKLGGRAAIELGDVGVMAEVKLNGKELGLLWKPPFRVEVGDLLKEKGNELEVRVTNLWINRLIGDEAYPPIAKYNAKGGIMEIPEWVRTGVGKPVTERKTFATWRFYKKGDALVPSGLMGPVRVVWGQ